MNRKLSLLIVLGGSMIAIFMALHSTRTAHAQNCGWNAQQTPIPCQPKKTKTPVPDFNPPTSTPTETATPTSVEISITDTPASSCVLKTWYRDADGDGYGIIGGTKTDCVQPPGYASNNMDCNDANASIHPGATDICGDGIDQNCDMADAACAAPSSPDVPTGGGGFSPWLFGGGGLLVGILIGLFLPFHPGSFFDRPPGPSNTPGDSSFDTEMSGGKGTPGGGNVGSFFDTPPGPPSTPGDDGVSFGPKHEDPSVGGGGEDGVSFGPKHEDPSVGGGGEDGVSFGPKHEDPSVGGGEDGVSFGPKHEDPSVGSGGEDGGDPYALSPKHDDLLTNGEGDNAGGVIPSSPTFTPGGTSNPGLPSDGGIRPGGDGDPYATVRGPGGPGTGGPGDTSTVSTVGGPGSGGPGDV